MPRARNAAPFDAPDGGLEVSRLGEAIHSAVVRYAEIGHGDVNALTGEGESNAAPDASGGWWPGRPFR